MLRRLGDLITERSKQLAETEVRDNGKLYAEMSMQTAYMAQWYHYYGGLADKIEGAVLPTDKPDTFNYTLRAARRHCRHRSLELTVAADDVEAGAGIGRG